MAADKAGQHVILDSSGDKLTDVYPRGAKLAGITVSSAATAVVSLTVNGQPIVYQHTAAADEVWTIPFAKPVFVKEVLATLTTANSDITLWIA